jgi:hypothetical protein
MTGLLTLYPFVAKDLLPFRQKLLVQNGVLDEFRALIPLGIHRAII